MLTRGEPLAFLGVLPCFLFLGPLLRIQRQTLVFGNDFGATALPKCRIRPGRARMLRHHRLREIRSKRRRRRPDFLARAPVTQAHELEQTRVVARKSLQTAGGQFGVGDVRRAARIGEVENEKSLDPLQSPDARAARQAAGDATFAANRLKTLRPRLLAGYPKSANTSTSAARLSRGTNRLTPAPIPRLRA